MRVALLHSHLLFIDQTGFVERPGFFELFNRILPIALPEETKVNIATGHFFEIGLLDRLRTGPCILLEQLAVHHVIVFEGTLDSLPFLG